MKLRQKRSELADSQQSSCISVDSVRVTAESVGVSSLADDAARELADQVTYRLRSLVQDAAKFRTQSKRLRMRPSDIDNALRVRNMEPLYGVSSCEPVPFRFTSGGGRELGFHEDKELELCDVIGNQVPKAPLDTAVKVHWLCIDGVQPAIPENPPLKTAEHQKQEATDPASTKLPPTSSNSSNTGKQLAHGERVRTVETVSVKQLAQHELSVELQLYYKEITEACVGSDESRRAEALQSLASDPGLHQMLPRLCNFIFEGVKVNVVQFNLALLIYLMRMVKALLDNHSLYLEKYLHEIIPSVVSCIVSRQLCARPESDNHWALRDFAARLLALLAKQFGTSTNNIQTRVSRLFVGCLENKSAPLAAHYGAIAGLVELGAEVIKAIVLPQLSVIGEKMERMTNLAAVTSAADRKTCDHFKELFKRKVAGTLATVRAAPDILDEYRRSYGHVLGAVMFAAVVKERQQQVASSTVSSHGAGVGGAQVAKNSSHVVASTRTVLSGGGRTILVSSGSSAAACSSSVVAGKCGTVAAPGTGVTGGGGKFVLVTASSAAGSSAVTNNSAALQTSSMVVVSDATATNKRTDKQ